uniref:C2H2-type domain-containing protein n=1 Tax=Strongyloides papillosus TaxID=174720 RepID=A0A0N5C5Z8_STREA
MNKLNSNVECQFCGRKIERSGYLDHLKDMHEYTDDKFLKKIVCPLPEYSCINGIKNDAKSEKLSNVIDHVICQLLKDHKHTDQFVFDIASALQTIFSATGDATLIKALSNTQFLNLKKRSKMFVKKLVGNVDSSFSDDSDSEDTENVHVLENNLDKAFSTDLCMDVANHLKTIDYASKENDNKLKVVVYFDDIGINNPLSSHRSNGMITHCGYSILNTNKESSKLNTLRTFAVSPTALLKSDRYESFFKETLKKFKEAKIAHKDKVYDLEIFSVIGDHPILQDLFKRKKNFGNRGYDQCRGCTIPASLYNKYLECKKVEEMVRLDHDIEMVPEWNHIISDSFHDISEGKYIILSYSYPDMGKISLRILGNMLYSAINNFLIVTRYSHTELKNDILAMSSEYECLKTLKSVLKDDFFKLSSEKKHIMKKGRFPLTGSQTNVLARMFYEVLKKFICSNEEINNFDSNIILKLRQHLYILKCILNLLYLMESFEFDNNSLEKMVEETVDNFFKILFVTYGENMKLSMKYHFILHYPLMIKKFGLPVHLSCKRFESLNKYVKDKMLLNCCKTNIGLSIIRKIVYDNFLKSLIHEDTISDPISLIRKTWDFNCSLDESLMECSTLEHVLEYEILNLNMQLNESIVNENNE